MPVFLDCFAVSKRRNEKESDIQKTTQTRPTMVLTVQQAAEYLGLAVSTLNKWRCLGDGPVFIKMGRAVRYRMEDLEDYILVSSASNTSAY